MDFLLTGKVMCDINMLNINSMNINSIGAYMKRQEQKEARRQEILYVALDLFVKKGYAATKITDIAEKASMSVGLLFHYFESKEKLYE